MFRAVYFAPLTDLGMGSDAGASSTKSEIAIKKMTAKTIDAEGSRQSSVRR